MRIYFPIMSRKAAVFEAYNIVRNHHGLYTNFAVTVKYSQPISKLLLSTALKALIAKVPFLTYGIKYTQLLLVPGALEDIEVFPVQSIVFDDVVDIIDKPFDASLLPEINAIRIPNSESTVTWKVLLYANNYVCFVNNHVFVDGGSIVSLHEDLLDLFVSFDGKDVHFCRELFTLDENLASQPAITDLVDLYQSSVLETLKLVVWNFVPNNLKQLYCYYFTKNYPDYVKHPKAVEYHEDGTDNQFKWLHLSKSATLRLLKAVKSQRVTLTSFLDTLIRYSFYQTVLRSTPEVSMASVVVVSGRRYYPEKKDLLRYNFVVTGCTLFQEPVESLLVERMQQTNTEIQRCVKTRENFKEMGLLAHFDPFTFVKPFLAKAPRRENYFEISNIGAFKASVGNWTIQDMVFSQCSGTSTILSFSVVSAEDGLNIIWSYPTELHGPEWDAFEPVFYHNIDQFCHQFCSGN